MSPPEIWGPIIWTFLHTLAEKVYESSYPELADSLFSYIYRICMVLPCPDCSNHAKRFLSNIKKESLRTKEDLRGMLFMFHNAVNRRKNKSHFPKNKLSEMYQPKNIIHAYQDFVHIYGEQSGNIRLLSDSFQRKILLKQLKKWLLQNITHFESSSISVPTTSIQPPISLPTTSIQPSISVSTPSIQPSIQPSISLPTNGTHVSMNYHSRPPFIVSSPSPSVLPSKRFFKFVT
jgi:hypothetical protein